MLYSLTAGGKRLRPVLLLAACEMAGGDLEDALPYACAIEMIHTYSLIHDDLPGMDNDDLRRGKPTNHRVFGEGMAILAGDGLLNASMEIMMRAGLQRNDMLGVRAAEILARHAGVTGMIAGQTADIISEGLPPEKDLVSYIHTHKTSDLIQAPVEMGMTLAGCEPWQIEAGRKYGYHLGIAFQIVDDLLDVTSTTETLGKPVGSDADNHKTTYVTLLGEAACRERIDRETELAVQAIRDAFDRPGFLLWLAQWLARRER